LLIALNCMPLVVSACRYWLPLGAWQHWKQQYIWQLLQNRRRRLWSSPW